MRLIAILLSLTLLPLGSALAQEDHPFAARSLSLEGPGDSSLLEWGPSSLSFSQTWAGGESYSQGFLLKEFRSQLHPTLSFQARFGLSFDPSSVGDQTGAAPRFELPEAVLTWRPGENTVLRLQFQRGSILGDPRFHGGTYGYDLRYGRPDPFGETP